MGKRASKRADQLWEWLQESRRRQFIFSKLKRRQCRLRRRAKATRFALELTQVSNRKINQTQRARLLASRSKKTGRANQLANNLANL